MYKTVTLSDGEECEVLVLGLFTEDSIHIEPEFLRPYMYQAEVVDSDPITVPYLLHTATEPEEKPEPPAEDAKFTREWYAWRDYHLYYAALQHSEDCFQAVIDYNEQLILMVIEKCIKPEDRDRLIEPSDILIIVKAALIPQLTMDDIKAALSETFKASYKDNNLLDFLLGSGDDTGFPLEMSMMRKWEYDAILKSGLSEEEWAKLTVGERARRTVAANIGDWQKMAESLYQLERMKANADPS